MASKFVILCLSLTLSLVMTPSLAAPPPLPSVQPPLPSWEPLPPTPPPPPTKNVTQQDINSICSKTHDPKFCLTTIEKIPQTNRTDLKDLETSVINEAVALLNESLKGFQPLIESTSELNLKDAHTLCAQHYYNAREDFMDGIKAMNKAKFFLPNYHVIGVLPNNAILEFKACEIDLKIALKNKPVTPLTDMNNKMIVYANLVATIGNYLYESLKSSASA